MSGTLDASDRIGLAEALDGIASHHNGRTAEGIIMGKLDRLARSLTVQEATLALAWRAGGRVFTAADGEILQDDPDDPMRTAMRQMMGVFSQLERTIIVGRLRAGRIEKSLQGGYAFGAPPFGSHSVDKELTPHEREQQTLARMRELREAGKSFHQIATILNQEARPPKRGSRWHPMTVSRALARNGAGESCHA